MWSWIAASFVFGATVAIGTMTLWRMSRARRRWLQLGLAAPARSRETVPWSAAVGGGMPTGIMPDDDGNATTQGFFRSPHGQGAETPETSCLALLQGVLDRIPACVAYIDTTGSCRVANRHALARSPVDASELLHRDALLRAGFLRRAMDGAVTRASMTLHIDGQDRHFSVRYEPYREHGAVCGVVVHAYEMTDQLRRQRALADSEVRFRRLAQASSNVVCHVASDGTLLYHHGWEAFTGCPPGAALADLFACVHADDRRALQRFLACARSHAEPATVCIRLGHRSGEYRCMLVRAVRIEPSSGTAPQWIGSLQDIQDQVEAMQRQVAAEDDLRLILDMLPARVAYVERDGRLRWANRAFLEWFDLHGNVAGRHVHEILTEADREAVAAPLQAAFAGRTAQVEWLQQHPVHGPCWALTTMTPRTDAHGAVQACITFCIDVTERKLTEQALERRGIEYAAVAESIPHMVFTTDRRGRATYFNRRWREYTGLDDPMAWLHAIEENGDAVQGALRRAVRTGSELGMEVRLQRHDGEVRWHELRALPLKDTSGRIERWYGTFTDIEDRKQAQVLLQRAQSRMQQFLATLSHELRNPLAALMTSAHLLARDDVPKPCVGELVATIQRQACQLQRLIEDLLDVSRITQGKIRLRSGTVDLRDIARDAFSDFRAHAAARQIALECDLARRPVWVAGDAARLRQIADNLLSNALKATPAGGRVKLRAAQRQRHGLLRVADGGAGIPDALLPQIYEPFVQDAEWIGEGLGLGLCVVAQLVRLHGGSVRARNLERGGACFDVRLPLSAGGAVPAAAATADATTCERAAGDEHPYRVLIVDDELDTAQTLQLFLGLHGFEVRSVSDGPSALACMRMQPADAVICDLGLPEPWPGHRVAAEIRSTSGTAPLLIAFSGYGTPSDVERAIEAGFDIHLLKPGNPYEVLALLRRGCGRDARDPTEPSAR